MQRGACLLRPDLISPPVLLSLLGGFGTCLGQDNDRGAPGASLRETLAAERLEWTWLGPGGCPEWQALCGQSPGFQGAKAKAGQEFLALIFASNSSQK